VLENHVIRSSFSAHPIFQQPAGSLITGIQSESGLKVPPFYSLSLPASRSSFSAPICLRRVTVEACQVSLRCCVLLCRKGVPRWEMDFGYQLAKESLQKDHRCLEIWSVWWVLNPERPSWPVPNWCHRIAIGQFWFYWRLESVETWPTISFSFLNCHANWKTCLNDASFYSGPHRPYLWVSMPLGSGPSND
jgi:hypothetical protein